MRNSVWFISVCLLGAIIFTSCGETIRGAWRDMQRIGEGTRRVMISD